MAARALVPGAAVAIGGFALALALNGPLSGVLALSGAVYVVGTFSLFALGLGWAREVSTVTVQAVALGGWLIRLIVFFGILFGLKAGDLDVAAFGLTALVAEISVAVYWAKLVASGLGSPPAKPAPAATPAGEARSDV